MDDQILVVGQRSRLKSQSTTRGRQKSSVYAPQDVSGRPRLQPARCSGWSGLRTPEAERREPPHVPSCSEVGCSHLRPVGSRGSAPPSRLGDPQPDCDAAAVSSVIHLYATSIGRCRYRQSRPRSLTRQGFHPQKGGIDALRRGTGGATPVFWLDIDNAARDPSRIAGIDVPGRSGGGVGLSVIPCAARFSSPEMQLIIPTRAVVGLARDPLCSKVFIPREPTGGDPHHCRK